MESKILNAEALLFLLRFLDWLLIERRKLELNQEPFQSMAVIPNALCW